ncbi:hypothetical protein KPH14_010888 [Odynerus spinipes]|uniref:CWH43-like N-terminal domain-containing protein n=1 Tax=Odynerus spinipes TaxID=1348599 RepID=A0AAD9RHX5_9HYME|nr:hypothetical protein KPH14_010888 [Odynerus spinipes]
MEKVSSAPTVKQRRKFEHIETTNVNNHDTSSVNHASDVYAIGKLSKCVHEEAQTLVGCCKESIEKYLLQEERNTFGRFTDPIHHSSVREYPQKMYKILLYLVMWNPLVMNLPIFIITYTMCKYKSPVLSDFLYISDTAQDFPESSIFSQSLNISVFTMGISIFLRHLQVLQFCRDHGQQGIKQSWIKLSAWFGLLTCLSIQMIANFPSITNGTINLHFIGVITLFVSFTEYAILQNKITYYMVDILCERRVYYLRLTISTIMLATAFAAVIPGLISWVQFKGEDARKWQPNDGGWIWHIISVVGEWMYVILIGCYNFTLSHELLSARIEMPVVKLTHAHPLQPYPKIIVRKFSAVIFWDSGDFRTRTNLSKDHPGIFQDRR